MAQEKLILIDGSAMLYRAFFAIPGTFTTSQGVPTNATYGFALMFKKLLAGRAPTHGAVVFDAPGKTFRDEQYPAYKAQRPSMAGELRAQLGDIDRIVAAHRYPVLRVEGYEADDVIGTLARHGRARGAEVLIVSGDKDFAQLIDDDVRMLDALKDVTYDRELVRKKWGVPPSQFVDLLALVGDKVDNIPGVPGIGQKGAVELLARFGTLDELLARAGELTGKRRDALLEHAELARLSRALATIDTAVPLPVDYDALALTAPEQGELNALYKELEFFSLLGREQVDDAFADEASDVVIARDAAAVRGFLAALPTDAPLVVAALHDPPSAVAGAVVGLALAGPTGAPLYVSVGGDASVDDDARRALLDALADPARRKIGHDLKAIMIALSRLGGTLGGPLLDVMLASFLIDPTKLIPHELAAIAKEYLQRVIRPRKSLTGSGQSERAFSTIPVEEVAAYAAMLADTVRALVAPIEVRLDEEGQRAVHDTLDIPLSRVLAQMEEQGILVDPWDLKKVGEDFAKTLASLEERIHGCAGRTFNIGSTKQLSEVLFDELKLPVVKKNKSGYSTDADVLAKLAEKHEIAALLLEHRKLAKLINTYTDVLQRSVLKRDGRIHATFQQTTSATGRLITTDPDLQRTPTKTPEGKRIRQAFIAPDGAKLVVADWSQIELRLLAHVSGDANLVDAFATGVDVHRRTAGRIFAKRPDDVTAEERAMGKTINFATIYGQGATALGQQLKIPRKEAQRLIESYFEAYEGVRRWVDATVADAHVRGYVETTLGRRRYIPELRSNAFMERQAGERIAANTPIQGSAADICKLAMLKIADDLVTRGLRARMVLQVHDELVFETPDDEVAAVSALVKEHMERVVPLKVPLVAEVGVGTTWAAAKG